MANLPDDDHVVPCEAHALFAREVQRKAKGVAGFAAVGIIFWIDRNRGNSRVISAMQIDDQRVCEDARGMLAPGPSAA